MSLSKHLTTHIDTMLLFFAKNSQKCPILKKSEIEKNNNEKNYNKMQSANKVKLTTQKRQAFVTLLIWEAFLVHPVWNTGTGINHSAWRYSNEIITISSCMLGVSFTQHVNSL